MNSVEWKTINGFDNYEVSDTGLIRNKKTKRVIKQFIKNGYCIVSLRNNKKSFQRTVHVFVAKAFNYNC